MIAWSAPSPALAIPDGPVDIYQSIQRLEPGAWVAAHTHEGPESGIVLTAELARFEDGATRTFAAGSTFCTAAGIVHATGNPFACVAEAITLHVLCAGTPFSTPCGCIGAPAPQSGSTNPVRSIVRDCSIAAAYLTARHARHRLDAPVDLSVNSGALVLVTVRDGAARFDGHRLGCAEYRCALGGGMLEPVADDTEVIVTVLELV